MKQSELLGALLPSSPNFQPIIEAIREKYGLSEISPDDDSIEEIIQGENKKRLLKSSLFLFK